MYTQQVVFLLNAFMLSDAGLVVVAGCIAYYIRWLISSYHWKMPIDILIYSMLFLMAINNFLMSRAGLYSDKRPKSFWEIVQKLVIIIFLDFSILNLGFFLLKLHISRIFISLYAIILLCALLLEKGLIEIFLSIRQKKGFNVRHILLVGNDKRAEHVLQALNRQRSWGHKFIGYLTPTDKEKPNISPLPCLGSLSDFENVLTREIIDEVVFVLSLEHSKINLKPYIKLCRKLGVAYRIVPAMYSSENKDQFYVEKI